jgi:hypothetical protein
LCDRNEWSAVDSRRSTVDGWQLAVGRAEQLSDFQTSRLPNFQTVFRFFTILLIAYKCILMPEEQDLDKRARGYRLRRSIMDYGMGIIILCLGIFFLLAPRLGVTFGIDDLFRYLFAGLCILYGIFRIYRGYKKNYFN